MNSRTGRRRNELDRRSFLRLSAATGLGAAAAGMTLGGCSKPLTRPRPLFRTAPMEKVRIGYVGVGAMGSNHVQNLLKLEPAEIRAVCDIVPEKVERIQKWVQDAGQPKPVGYTRGEYDFIRMCENEDLDLVYTATPWKWHVPVCVAAMKNDIHAATKYGADSPQAKQKYALSDVVTTIIRTVHGQTIIVKHDTGTPRPYSRDILVQGTKGLVRKYPTPKVYIEGVTPHHHWEEVDKYLAQYEHPLWKALAERTQDTGHGGMDFIEDYRLIESLRKGEPTDIDVYDAAAWSAVSELSEHSIAKGSQPVDFPDFTRGKWKTTPPLGIVSA